MKKVILLLFTCICVLSAIAQTVTSVAGLDFGTNYTEARRYLLKHFGGNYDEKGDYLMTFYDVMIGGFTYDNAEFYFKDSKFIAARLYSGFALSKLSNAKSFRDRIISKYKTKYWHNKPFTSDGFQCYSFGSSMYPNYQYYAINLWMRKDKSNEGTLMYWVENEYYMQFIKDNNDDI